MGMKELTLRRIVIDGRAIEANFGWIKTHLGDRTRPIWVVKSRAYGFGLECLRNVSVDIAGHGGEDFKAVGEVLSVDGSKPVFVIYPLSPAYCPPSVLPRVWDGSVVPTVAEKGQVDQWVHLARQAGVEGFEIQIKVRSFGGRFGSSPQELVPLIALARRHGLRIGGIFSHPSHSTVSTDADIREECRRFVEIARRAAPEAPLHFGDSACVMKGIGVDLDRVRVGMLPLGLLPVEPEGKWSSLRFALTLFARMVSIHRLEKEEGVGYTLLVGTRPSHVAVTAIGYAHGIPRMISESGHGWWRGRPLSYAAPPGWSFRLSPSPRAKRTFSMKRSKSSAPTPFLTSSPERPAKSRKNSSLGFPRLSLV